VKILIAEDDPVSRRLLQATLEKWDHDVIAAEDGLAAWEALSSREPPQLLVLDWMMPQLDGVALTRRIRARDDGQLFYILLLTAKMQMEDIVTGLNAGADDYLTKPFQRDELHARIGTGIRILTLQRDLDDRIRELEQALAEVRQLSGLLPICAYCKRIRDDDRYWQSVEQYLSAHTEVQFSHGVCPACYDKHVKPELERLGDSSVPQDDSGD
jgi:sigma-B regulation protein RsbU (phosphoserine phosphatase)